MHIKSIRLKNVRSYTDHKLEFPKGSTLLSGDIGSGKSSVLLAIEFALFGIIRGQLEGGSILRHGEVKGEVELNFSTDGNDVTIRRTLKRSKADVRQDSGSLAINGKTIVATPVELKSKILELLGYPKEALTKTKSLIYRYTVYTPQEEMRRILTEESAARKETLRTVFGVDKYSRAAENARILLRNLRENKRVLEAKFDGIENDKEKFSFLQNSIKDLDGKILKTNKELSEIQNLIKDMQEKLKELEKDRIMQQKLRQDIAVLNAELKEKQNVLGKNLLQNKDLFSELSKLENELKALSSMSKVEIPPDIDAKLEDLRKKFLDASTKKAKYEQKAKQAKEQINHITEEIGKLNKKVAEIETIQKEIIEGEKEAADILNLNGKIELLEKNATEFQKHLGKHETIIKEAGRVIKDIAENSSCPLCKQQISQNHRQKIQNEEDNKKSNSEAEIRELKSLVAKNREEIRAEKARRDSLISLKTRIEGLKKEAANMHEITEIIDGKKASLVEFESIYGEASLVLEELKSEVIETQLEKLIALKKTAEENAATIMKEMQIKKDIAEINKRKEKLSNETRLINAEIKNISAKIEKNASEEKKLAATAEKIDDFGKALDSTRDKEKKCLIEISSSKAELEAKKNESDSLKQIIESKQLSHEQSQNLGSIIHWLGAAAIPSFVLMEQRVLGRIYHEFNDLLRTWFAMLMEDETMSCRLSSDFAPIIEQNGYECPLYTLSGGERTSIALAYRLALNRVINDLISNIKTNDLLILDEPTEGFSSEQLDRVRHVLTELELAQIIIVSHEQKIESFVDHIIRISKTQHNSTTA